MRTADTRYVTTQAVADYLATAHEPPLDGIVYRSAQVKRGKNVVLFNHASRVLDSDAADGDRVEVGVRYGDIDEGKLTYDVLEHMPAAPPEHPKGIAADEVDEWLGPASPTLWEAMQQEPDPDRDSREVSLRLDGTALAVHDVAWTRFGTTTAPVTRRKAPHGTAEEEF